jgi:hypothetical protein
VLAVALHASAEARQAVRELGAPRRPVVRPLMAPELELEADARLAEESRECPRGNYVHLGATRRLRRTPRPRGTRSANEARVAVTRASEGSSCSMSRARASRTGPSGRWRHGRRRCTPRRLRSRRCPAVPAPYVWIYRNGSRFAHPSSHVVGAFVNGHPPELTVGDEDALEKQLALIGTAVLALGLTGAARFRRST